MPHTNKRNFIVSRTLLVRDRMHLNKVGECFTYRGEVNETTMDGTIAQIWSLLL